MEVTTKVAHRFTKSYEFVIWTFIVASLTLSITALFVGSFSLDKAEHQNTNAKSLQSVPILPIYPIANQYLGSNGAYWIPMNVTAQQVYYVPSNASLWSPIPANVQTALNILASEQCASNCVNGSQGPRGPIGPPGLNGTQGIPGPPGLNGSCDVCANDTNAVALQGVPILPNTPIYNNILLYNGVAWLPQPIPGVNNSCIQPCMNGTNGMNGANGSCNGLCVSSNATTLLGYPICSDAPSIGQFLGWNTTCWGPTNLPSVVNETNAVSLQLIPISTIAPVNGQVLSYNGIFWIPTTLSPFINETNAVALQFVPISTIIPTTGQYLSYNGMVWIPASFPEFVNDTNAVSLQFVPISTTLPTNGQYLSFNGAFWIPTTLPTFINETNAVALQFVPISTTAPTLNQYLSYNGAFWIPTTLPTFINETNAVALQFVPISTTAPTLNQYLSYNGAFWIPTTLPTFINETNAVALQFIPISTTVPNTGQYLSYNGVFWIPTTLPTFINETNAVALQFVPISITTPISGQFLGFNGMVWIPTTLPNLVNETNAVSLQGVGISPTVPINGQVLIYNGALWIPTSVPGFINETNAVSIQNIPVSTTIPTINQVLQFTGSVWLPQPLYPITNSTNSVYVNKGGNDATADGTQNRPFLTIRAAMLSIPENSGLFYTIYIGSGDYVETGNLAWKSLVFLVGPADLSVLLIAGGGFTITLSTLFPASFAIIGITNVKISGITLNINFQSLGTGGFNEFTARNCWFYYGLITNGRDVTDIFTIWNSRLDGPLGDALDCHGGMTEIIGNWITANVLLDDKGTITGTGINHKMKGNSIDSPGILSIEEFNVQNTMTVNILTTNVMTALIINGTSNLTINIDAISIPNFPILNGSWIFNRLTYSPAIGYVPAAPALWQTQPTTTQLGLDLLASGKAPAFVSITNSQTINVGKGGSDTTGDGTPSNPVLTLAKALTLVGTASNAIPWSINMGPGVFVENVISLKPGVWVRGIAPSDTVIQVATMNFSTLWSAGSSFGGLSNVQITSATPTLSFQATGGSGTRNFYIQNVMFSVGLILKGLTGTDQFNIMNSFFLTDGSFGLEIHTGTLDLQFSQFFSGILIDDLGGNAGTITTVRANANEMVLGGVTITQYRTADGQGISFFNTRVNSAYTTNGTSNVFINLDADSYTNLAITNPNGAVITRLTYANGIGYTPATSANWNGVPTTVGGALDSIVGPTTSIAGTFISGSGGGASDFSQASTISLYRLNNQVFIKVGTFTGTLLHNATPNLVTATGTIPTGYTPSTTRNKLILTQDGGVGAIGELRVLSNGQIEVFKNISIGNFAVGDVIGTTFDEDMTYII